MTGSTVQPLSDWQDVLGNEIVALQLALVRVVGDSASDVAVFRTQHATVTVNGTSRRGYCAPVNKQLLIHGRALVDPLDCSNTNGSPKNRCGSNAGRGQSPATVPRPWPIITGLWRKDTCLSPSSYFPPLVFAAVITKDGFGRGQL